ncbi:B Chain Kynurenine Aminotransferase Ii Inhibitor [Micractinium conductrix]|uniref:B Chain Kynurenine Aminotransferase Ii Inhibitor n=1 Tax=Micractinium conductrix TaxID=554055 RepID=A0A2P6VPB0_9CHLO|nr:B Chain Kynurenine Aminotransferase Ii Inhibitor [Micractinium conductrix]|eukprot:PSC75895.1 B Chain Kynurenine Aminotransferase Ii Inhibitor [Micractinium conductrix]
MRSSDPAGPCVDANQTATTAAATGAAAAPTAAPPPGAPFDALALLSRHGRCITGGSLRSLVSRTHGLEGLVGLHGGLPPEHVFPLTSLRLGLQGGRCVELSAASLMGAQQYTMVQAGLPSLHQWAVNHVRTLHTPPGGHDLLLTSGASHALEMVCSLFLDPGDAVAVEEYSYPQLLECHLVPRGCRVLPVAMDDEGVLPESLEQALAGAQQRGEPLPKLFYSVPTGHNPTGIVTSLERRRAVYGICRRYGLLIVEDDAYFYLQFPQGTDSPPGLAGLPRHASYLSLDVDGRVVRIDTFAKFLAPGLRLGWAVAAPAVAEKLTHLMQAQTLGPSGLSMALTDALLAEWGDAGLDAHLRLVQSEYAAKAAALHAAAQRELAGLAEWRQPRAGMFMWVRLLGVDESSQVLDALQAERVVCVAGRICHPRAADPAFRCPYLRLSFSHPPAERLEEGVRRVGVALRRLAQEPRRPPPPGKWWKPQRYNADGSFTRFQYQLSDAGTITYVAGVQVYAIDFDTAETAIPALRQRNAAARFVCYFSAGSWEEYRVDDDQAKRGIAPGDWGSALGDYMAPPWTDERWVDVRDQSVRSIMQKRLRYCKDIGCDGVDPDNVNGHANPTGFPLTKANLVEFNTWLAAQAHTLGMGIGLKNGVDMVPQLHPHFDWALNEECISFSECTPYSRFASSKPIWGIEYCNAQAELGVPTQDPGCVCAKAASAGLNFLIKRVALDAAGISCSRYCASHACVAKASCQAAAPSTCGVLPAAPVL